ncbi:MAG: SDR family oxidoreductase [Nitrospirae bacterium]|nr:SDR family oxidoreductase [Nitrospirota bacterium]
MERLNGKVALITGGGTGIGEAIARLFAQEGAAVVITGRRKEILERVVGEIERGRGRALAVAGTVTDEAHVQSVVAQTLRTFGKLSILINNAAIGAFGKALHETDDATWDEQLAVNLTGVFRMTRAAVPEMLKAGGGTIVNVSSVAGLIGFPLSAAYSTTKGGLNAFTRCVAMDYAKQGIRCNAVCPGLVETPMAAGLLNDSTRAAPVLATYPLGRAGTPDEVARLVLYLASDESAWVTGSIFPIDGGLTAQ